MTATYETAIHEAGHCLASLSFGIRVTKLAAKGKSGICVSAPGGTPRQDAVVTLSGPVAASVLIGPCDAARVSSGDLEFLARARRNHELMTGQPVSDALESMWWSEAKGIVLRHAQRIEGLARRLAEFGEMSEDEIAICANYIPSPLDPLAFAPLSAFAWLYPEWSADGVRNRNREREQRQSRGRVSRGSFGY